MQTVPRIPALSAKTRALRAWHKTMSMHQLGLTLATLPRFPVIDGTPRTAQRPHFAPRPVPAGAA